MSSLRLKTNFTRWTVSLLVVASLALVGTVSFWAWPVQNRQTRHGFNVESARPPILQHALQRSQAQEAAPAPPAESVREHPQASIEERRKAESAWTIQPIEQQADRVFAARFTSATPPARVPEDDPGTAHSETHQVDVKSQVLLNAPLATSLAQKLRSAVHAGQVLDARDQEEARLRRIRRLQRSEPMPLIDPPPVPVTRFDVGLGMLDAIPIPRPQPTTGHNRAFLPTEEPDARDALFVSQSPSRRRNMGARSPACFAAAGIEPLSQAQLPYQPPGCNDGRDNNGNGLIDREDPVCWADGRSPHTYASWMTESEPLPINFALPLASPPTAP